MGGKRSIRSRVDRHDGGASLVEFALLAPLIFALIFGMLTGGLALSRKNSMENAVREAARLGATLQEDAAWADKVKARAVQLSSGDLSSSQVCVKLVKSNGTSAGVVPPKRATACSAALLAEEPSAATVPTDTCVVKVWARRPAEFNFIFASPSIALTTEAINRYERTGTPVACG